jgi:hypothetical protein
MLTDERNWLSGLHGGARLVCEGSKSVAAFDSSDGPRKEEQP